MHTHTNKHLPDHLAANITACKNWVVRYWWSYLSGVFLAPVKSRMVYLSGAGLPRLSRKKPLNRC